MRAGLIFAFAAGAIITVVGLARAVETIGADCDAASPCHSFPTTIHVVAMVVTAVAGVMLLARGAGDD